MKPNRINLIPAVRRGLIASGYSTTKVVNAVNAALGEIKLESTSDKTGDGKVTKDSYKVTVTGTFKYTNEKTAPLLFDAWHSAIAKADKIASMEAVEIPSFFVANWLKFAKSDKATVDAELARLDAETVAANA